MSPPFMTVTGGTTTPVCGSRENLSTISIKDQAYLLRVVLRVFFDPLRPFLVLRLPPFKGIAVGHPMPPGKLHQT